KRPIPGMTSSWLYTSPASGKRTAASLHKEDLNLPSVNIVIAGVAKLWLWIVPADTEALEERLKEEFHDEYKNVCSQGVRHLSILLSPRQLEAWNIRYGIKICREGEIIVTLPGTYHQVVNLRDNVAEALNFAFE
ncbi:transcription factor jumonji, partial [Byssothecium circinans]